MRATRILGTAFLKHKYLTNPTVTPEDRVIEAAGALAQAIKNQMPPHMHEFTIQALSNLQDVFQQATINYNADPATHVTTAAPPRVPPDTLTEPATPATSPRMHDIPNTPVVPTQLNFFEDSFYPQQVFPQKIPWPNPPAVRAPSSPPKQPHQSQQIATTWQPADDDAPARNTQSCTQARSITQEAILACTHVHNDITGCPFMAKQASCRKFPREILNAVLNTDTGALMEMRHLLINPKYKELWGKSYTIELGCLAQSIPGVSNGTNTIVFIQRGDVLIDQRKDVMYGRVCINYRPEKANPNCTCLTIGSNCITYPGDCGTPTVDMVTVKYISTALSPQRVCATAQSI
jgi:hypothetical protein